MPAGSYDYVVDDDGSSADFATIQDAIDASTDDDVVYVCPGHYKERITVDHRLSLLSLAGAEETVIDADGGNTVVGLYASTTLVGFTITGAEYTTVCLYGGGIKLGGQPGVPTADYVIENNRIVDNGACKVGGIYVSGFSSSSGDTTTTTAFISNNLIARNYSGTTNTGGISLRSTSPCRNSGDPAAAYDDVDGTRNDIGAYGGPLGDW